MSNYRRSDPRKRGITISAAEAYFLKALRRADEITARRFAAQRAMEIGYGGIARVAKITGMSKNTIVTGINELKAKREVVPQDRQRRAGGGRKRVEEVAPQLVAELKKHMEDATAGDPMSELRWTSQSLRSIAAALGKKGS